MQELLERELGHQLVFALQEFCGQGESFATSRWKEAAHLAGCLAFSRQLVNIGGDNGNKTDFRMRPPPDLGSLLYPSPEPGTALPLLKVILES